MEYTPNHNSGVALLMTVRIRYLVNDVKTTRVPIGQDISTPIIGRIEIH